MTTPDTPVEQLIGWIPHEEDLPHRRIWVTADGKRIRERAEVDDLLPWLRAHTPSEVEMGEQDRETGFPADAPPGYWVSTPLASGGRVHSMAPRLRDALVAAVRAVSEEA